MELETKAEIVTITDEAFDQVLSVIKQQPKTDLFLRVFVQGGCGGVGFGMAIDQKEMPDDTIFMVNDLKVAVDKVSMPYVSGATIDFDSTGEKQGFRITNPNAEALMSQAGGCSSGSCGAGGCC
ncbi:MAG: HesB/IscA family protein [Candidatus Kariarchaeaceae archaeon]|jgi:iron-sulfur cluster assembly accessory protein